MSELQASIESLFLPARIQSRLEHENITTVGELIGLSSDDLLAWPGFGAMSLREVRRALAEHNLALRGDQS